MPMRQLEFDEITRYRIISLWNTAKGFHASSIRMKGAPTSSSRMAATTLGIAVRAVLNDPESGQLAVSMASKAQEWLEENYRDIASDIESEESV